MRPSTRGETGLAWQAVTAWFVLMVNICRNIFLENDGTEAGIQ
jgi:hypothetical protein